MFWYCESLHFYHKESAATTTTTTTSFASYLVNTRFK